MASETHSTVGPWNDQSLLVKFRELMLAEHNKRRADHGSGKLKLSDKLNIFAQEWAELNAEMEESIHRPDCRLIYGESLHRDFWLSAPVDIMAQLIANDFYKEVNSYEFDCADGDPKNRFDVDHVTQMLWYDTTEMGVGIAKGESGFVYCVINYNPRGNISGEYGANIFSPGTVYKSKTDQLRFVPSAVRKRNNSPFIDIFRKLLTNQHNIHRKRHGVPFVRNVEYLNQIAQNWAEQLAHRDLVDSSNSCYGENIYQLLTSDPKTYPTPIEICKSFANEGTKYNYECEDVEGKSGHYTQMVWMSTTAIGIGLQKAASGNVYVVCNYNPPGNVHGEYSKNVFAPISHVESQPKRTVINFGKPEMRSA